MQQQARVLATSVPVMTASRLQLPPGGFETLLDGLCARFPGIDRGQWQRRMAQGMVLDEQCRPLAMDAPYAAGRTVFYFREVEDEAPIPFDAELLHMDQDLVVADKPHFLPVAPTGIYVRQTLLSRLVRQLDNPELVPLHRLDRGTAGLVLFSARRCTRDAYQALFRERRIEKGYEALAPALPGAAMPLLRQSRLEQGEPFFRMREVEGMGNAITRIRVLERGARIWRYGLSPVTGRKHQLRVHMATLGAPILNDRVYPELLPQGPDDHSRPLQLLARTLAFTDPLTGASRHFESRLRLQSVY